MSNAIAFMLVIAVFALIISVAFTLGLRKRRRIEMQEAMDRVKAAVDKKVWDQSVADKMEQIKNQKPHPSDPAYRHTVPLNNTSRTSYADSVSTPPAYDPMTDMLSPLNPLSPLNHIYHSDPDPTPSHSHDHSPSYSAPDPSPSPSHDSSSSYGGDSYGGSSYDSGSSGGGYDGGSSGGGGDF